MATTPTAANSGLARTTINRYADPVRDNGRPDTAAPQHLTTSDLDRRCGFRH
jgi:hypothetical protein